MSIEVLAVDKIKVPDDRQRKTFTEQEMWELGESIQGPVGLLQPVSVRPDPDGDGYLLVSGERRFRTISNFKKDYFFGDLSITAGFIPALVKTFAEEITIIEAELHENIVRVDLTWQEKVEAVKKLHELKVAQNPNHRKGDTARLISQPDGEDRDYAKTNDYQQVRSSLLVGDFLDNPEVSGAKNLTQARKIVTRIVEQEQLEKLKAIQAKKQEAVPLDDLIEDGEPSNSREPPRKIVKEVKLGEFYHGDIREHLLNIEPVSCIITDPPYGIGVADHGDAGYASLKHEYSEDDFYELHEYLIASINVITTDNAHCYIFCDFDFFKELKMMFATFAGDWRVRAAPLVWDKGNKGKLESGTSQGYTRNSEYILFATKGDRPCSKVRRDILQFEGDVDKVHAAQKPATLYRELMDMSCVPGDRVLDCFAGSGTIFRAASDGLYTPVGIELSDKFSLFCEEARTKKVDDYELDF